MGVLLRLGYQIVLYIYIYIGCIQASLAISLAYGYINKGWVKGESSVKLVQPQEKSHVKMASGFR
jgi:hypothetical protein